MFCVIIVIWNKYFLQKHNNSTSNGTGPAPGAGSHHEKDSASSTSQQRKQKSNPSVAAAVTAEEKIGNSTAGVESDEDFDNDERFSNTSDDVSPASCKII